MPSTSKYNKGQHVECFHGGEFYEAVCLEAEVDKQKIRYLVHYCGWNKRWDEWVPASYVRKVHKKQQQKRKIKRTKHTENHNEETTDWHAVKCPEKNEKEEDDNNELLEGNGSVIEDEERARRWQDEDENKQEDDDEELMDRNDSVAEDGEKIVVGKNDQEEDDDDELTDRNGSVIDDGERARRRQEEDDGTVEDDDDDDDDELLVRTSAVTEAEERGRQSEENDDKENDKVEEDSDELMDKNGSVIKNGERARMGQEEEDDVATLHELTDAEEDEQASNRFRKLLNKYRETAKNLQDAKSEVCRLRAVVAHFETSLKALLDHAHHSEDTAPQLEMGTAVEMKQRARQLTNNLMSRLFSPAEMAVSVLSGGSKEKGKLDHTRVSRVVAEVKRKYSTDDELIQKWIKQKIANHAKTEARRRKRAAQKPAC